MNLFLDTEFNSFKGELMSIGLIAENGKSYYRELRINEDYDSWVERHVVPLLDADEVPVEIVQDELQKYLLQFESINIVVDWPDDIKYFCELLIIGPGEMIYTIPKITFELRRDINSEDSLKPHHAGYDAEALKNAYAKVKA